MTQTLRAQTVPMIALALIALISDASIAGTPDTQPAEQPALPPNHSLVDTSPAAFHLTGPAASTGTSRLVDVTDTPTGFTQAMEVAVSQRAGSDWDIQYELPLTDAAIKKGDVVWLGVWARMIHTADESGQGILGLVLEQSKDPYNKLIERRASVGPQWQMLAVPARAAHDFPAGSLHITLRIGGTAQTLQIGGAQLLAMDDPAGVKLADLPQTHVTYGGREADAAWRKAADERIEQIRKGNLTVHVTDAAGKPVSGAIVAVDMKQHAFPFGCVYAPRSIVGPGAQSPENLEYQKRFVELFNVGVDEYAMKWPGWVDPAQQKTAIDALDWMTAHGVKVRGHNLVWPNWNRLPDDLKRLKDDKVALAKAVDDHITQEVTQLRGRVTEWDVINEPYVNKDLMKILGYDAMAHWFTVAHTADPVPPLLLNETSVPTNPPGDQHYDVLYQQVKAIKDAGAPIGGIGMQAHFGSSLTSIADLQRIYDRFATLGLPVEITEFDLDLSDEQLQADYLRDFMTFSFSHPDISGFMMWGFVANHHWRPAAALWQSDWTIKPVGQAWLDLVKKKWWTNASLTTAADGSATTRGFLGDYTITVTADGKTQTLPATLAKDGTTLDVVMK